MSDEFTQLLLPFDDPFAVGENPALWTPRDIWVRLSQRVMSHFAEDRRIEYKRAEKVDFDDLTTYYSAFSNTPDGGVIVYGADSKGNATGCSTLLVKHLNSIENFHLQLCPQARPEIKRIAVIINGKEDFCVCIYVPYIGKLVETNKGDAWIRYGDSKHKMSEEEKRDFRATRQELSFEQEIAPFVFPDDFDLRIIQDFCDAFRAREGRNTWSNEDVLIDRHLARGEGAKLIPLNALVLLAAKDPRKSIPGCRVRVQRFASASESPFENCING